MKNFFTVKGLPLVLIVSGVLALKLMISVGLMLASGGGADVPAAAAVLAPSPRAALAADEPEAAQPSESAQPTEGETAPDEGAAPSSEDEDMELRRIERERRELELLRTEVDGKLADLEAIQIEILMLIEQLEGVYDKKEKHLVKILSGMPPKKAAPMINNLDMDLIVKIFAGMKSDVVGKILPYLEPEKAAEIGERLASRQQE